MSRTIAASNLRVPYPVSWRATQGRVALGAASSVRTITSGECCSLPAETLFSLRIEPGVEGRAAGVIVLDALDAARRGGPDWTRLVRAFRSEEACFGHALAQQMFVHPAYGWRMHDVAAMLGETARSLQMRLFREAYSFSATLRRCRMLRVLLGALSGDAPVPDMPLASICANAQKRDSLFEAAFETRLSMIEKSRLPVSA